MNNSNRNKSTHPKKMGLAAIVLLGGAAVLASYAYILAIDPATRDSLWGGVPSALLPGYTASMVLAAVGYFAFPMNGNTNMDFCITIRTILKQGQRTFIQAGAGIVADSDPRREHDECVSKASALAEAIRIAEENP